MTNSSPTLEEIEAFAAEIEALIKEDNLLYDQTAKSPKAGLRVFTSDHGVYVAAVNKNGKQRRFGDAEKIWLNRVLPVLYPTATPAGTRPTHTPKPQSADALFSKESERERLFVGMRNRLLHVQESMAGKRIGPPVMVGGKELPQPRHTALESFDPDATRQIPSASRLRNMKPADHAKLPRWATWVQLEPPPPRRYMAMSEFEFPLDKTRPDEVFISYELDAAELDAVTGPEPKAFSELKPVKAHNLSIHVADLNTELSSSRALNHFKETTHYLIETLKFVQELGVVPVGDVRLSARDTYLHSAMVKLGFGSEGVMARIARWRKIFGKRGTLLGETSVIHAGAVARRTVDAETGALGDWHVPDNQFREVRVIGRLSRKSFEEAVTNLFNKDVLSKLLRLLPR